MKTKKTVAPNIKTAETKIDGVISRQVDKTIDKIVDKTFDKIKKEEHQEKKKVKNADSAEQKKDERIVFGLSYFLFFISLIFSKSDERKFYANQGLVLLMFLVAGGVFFRFVIGLLHYETSLILSLIFYVFVVLFALYGFIKTLRREELTRLPLIGRIKLIK